MMSLIVALLLSAGAPDASAFVGPPAGAPIGGDALVRRTDEVSALLRCPVCQGMSVADSPSEMAVNMKGLVRELLARGYSKEQILEYFERSYGQFVLLEPKFEGVNTLVWLLPVVALVFGAIVLMSIVRRVEEPADDPYVARVRKMVGRGNA